MVEVYRDVLARDDLVPGLIAGIQTFGDLVPFHPHIHAIATDSGFLPNGTILCLPRIDTSRLLAAWQTKVFKLLLAAEKIDQPTVDQMRRWPHSGFSVDNRVRDRLAACATSYYPLWSFAQTLISIAQKTVCKLPKLW